MTGLFLFQFFIALELDSGQERFVSTIDCQLEVFCHTLNVASKKIWESSCSIQIWTLDQ